MTDGDLDSHKWCAWFVCNYKGGTERLRQRLTVEG